MFLFKIQYESKFLIILADSQHHPPESKDYFRYVSVFFPLSKK